MVCVDQDYIGHNIAYGLLCIVTFTTLTVLAIINDRTVEP